MFHFNPCGDGVRVAYPLFQKEGDGAIPISPLQLYITEISEDLAIKLNKLWHSRLPNFYGMSQLCFGAEYKNIFYACAIWSNPVARLLPQHNWLELRRMAISSDAPKNTASRMIKIMVNKIKIKRPYITTLISYQDTEVHSGTIYKASGWKAVAYNPDGDWNRPNRYRPPSQSYSPKIRWQKELKKELIPF